MTVASCQSRGTYGPASSILSGTRRQRGTINLIQSLGKRSCPHTVYCAAVVNIFIICFVVTTLHICSTNVVRQHLSFHVITRSAAGEVVLMLIYKSYLLVTSLANHRQTRSNSVDAVLSISTADVEKTT
jgi:hypothetical protein